MFAIPLVTLSVMKRESAAHESERKKLKKLLTVRLNSLGSHLRLAEKRDETGWLTGCIESAASANPPKAESRLGKLFEVIDSQAIAKFG
jgi:hypothetical protein